MASHRSHLLVAKARPADAPVVFEIFDEAARWLNGRGIEQWQSPLPPEFCALLNLEIGQGLVYLARSAADGEPVGTFRLHTAASGVWAGESGSAVYLYSLAVRRAWQGKAIGARLIDWTAAFAGTLGVQYVRLECLANNDELRRYYARNGFRLCREADADELRYALFERPTKPERTIKINAPLT